MGEKWYKVHHPLQKANGDDSTTVGWWHPSREERTPSRHRNKSDSERCGYTADLLFLSEGRNHYLDRRRREPTEPRKGNREKANIKMRLNEVYMHTRWLSWREPLGDVCHTRARRISGLGWDREKCCKDLKALNTNSLKQNTLKTDSLTLTNLCFKGEKYKNTH